MVVGHYESMALQQYSGMALAVAVRVPTRNVYCKCGIGKRVSKLYSFPVVEALMNTTSLNETYLLVASVINKPSMSETFLADFRPTFRVA